MIDEPEAVVDAIFDFYETRGFNPTRAQREALLISESPGLLIDATTGQRA